MVRGRKPKPTALKEIDGNHGKPLPKNEPRPDVAIPTPPDWLSSPAKSEWRRVTKELNALGMISRLDRAALAGYCSAWAALGEAEKILAQEGYALTKPTGEIVSNPLARTADAARASMRSYLVELGLSPASRPRIQVDKKTDANAEEKQLESIRKQAEEAKQERLRRVK